MNHQEMVNQLCVTHYKIPLTSANKMLLNMTDGTSRIASGIVFCNYNKELKKNKQ